SAFGNIISNAKYLYNRIVLVANSLIRPGYPYPFTIPADVFIFIVDIFLRIYFDIFDHEAKIKTTRLNFRHNSSNNMVAEYLFFSIIKELLCKIIKKSDLPFCIHFKDDAVHILDKLLIFCLIGL